MGIFDKMFAPNIEKLKEKRDVDGLIRALDYNKDVEVRGDAADALGELFDVRAVVPLIKAMIRSSFWPVTYSRLDFAGRCFESDGFGSIAKVICLKDEGTSCNRALEKIYVFYHAIKVVYENYHALVYEGKIYSLLDEGLEKAIAKVLEKYPNYSHIKKEFRSHYGGDLYANIFLSDLSDYYNKIVQPHAINADEEFRRAEVLYKGLVKELCKALEDTNEYVRLEAAFGLTIFGDASAVEPLTKAHRDSNKTVRQYAAEALENIHGQVRGDDSGAEDTPISYGEWFDRLGFKENIRKK